MRASHFWGVLLVCFAFNVRIVEPEQSPPRFQSRTSSLLNATSGDLVRLKCRVKGAPQPRVAWTKDGTQLQRSEGIRFLNSNQTVKIISVTLQDAGRYRCTARNALGMINSTVDLRVTSGPEPYFTEPDDMKKKFIAWPATHSLRLKCQAAGAPPIRYQWLKDGKTVGPRRLPTKWYFKLKDLSLKDSGQYTCVVSNRYGSINHTYTLQVVEKPTSKPHLQMGLPANTTVHLGQNATLTCIVIVTGTLPDFRWLKWNVVPPNYSKTLDFERNSTSYRLINPRYYGTVKVENHYGVELTVVNVTKEDLGLYTCYVSNHIGYDFNSAFLSEAAPTLSPTLPRTAEPTGNGYSTSQGHAEAVLKAKWEIQANYVAIIVPAAVVVIVAPVIIFFVCYYQKKAYEKDSKAENQIQMLSLLGASTKQTRTNHYVAFPVPQTRSVVHQSSPG